MPASPLSELTPWLSELVRDKAFPSIQCQITEAGKVVYRQSFGRAAQEEAAPVREDQIFRAFSLTKPMTSVLLLMAVEDGLVGLDDPLGRYLPAFAEQQVYTSGTLEDFTCKKAENTITLRHLLSHQ